MIRHRCPQCQTLLSTAQAFAGREVECSQCQGQVKVPYSSIADGAAPAGSPAEPNELLDQIGEYLNFHTGRGTPEELTIGKRLMYGLLGIIVGLCTGLLVCMLPLAWYEQHLSQSWPTAEGEITFSGVSEKVEKDSKGRKRTEYSAAVRYDYTVAGQKHSGSRIGFGIDQNYSMLAERLAGQYREGQKVTVYYDPDRPESAVLQRTVLLGTYLWSLPALSIAWLMLRMTLASFAPVVESSTSEWLPWSRRLTWPDLPMLVLAVGGFLLLLPMMFGL